MFIFFQGKPGECVRICRGPTFYKSTFIWWNFLIVIYFPSFQTNPPNLTHPRTGLLRKLVQEMNLWACESIADAVTWYLPWLCFLVFQFSRDAMDYIQDWSSLNLTINASFTRLFSPNSGHILVFLWRGVWRVSS